MSTRPSLTKTLTIGQAIGLALSIVIGSGLLVLPGLAYEQIGNAALYAWLIDALLVVPLLIIFAYLGAHYPSAGGIAGFVQAAFGRAGAAIVEILMLGTFSLGIPAIAITGAQYFAVLVGDDRLTLPAALGLLLLAGGVNLLGTQLSGRFQQILTFTLVGLLGLVSVVSLFFGNWHNGTGLPSPSQWSASFPLLGLIFFAYTGWEMLSSTAEEFRNPRRDFPLTVIGSFLLIVLLYLLMALAVQFTLSPTNPYLKTAPLAALLFPIFGLWSGKIVAALGAGIIAANLIGAIWAASRLVFSSAREGLLPATLQRLHPTSRIPHIAVYTVITLFSLIVLLHFGFLSLSVLLQLAGQNFFILYGLCVIAYIKLVQTWPVRLFGFATLLLTLFVMSTFSWGLLYPLALATFGFLLYRLRKFTRPIAPLQPTIAEQPDHHSSS